MTGTNEPLPHQAMTWDGSRRSMAGLSGERRRKGIDLTALNLLDSHICLLDDRGDIEFVNDSWSAFANENQYRGDAFGGLNYLDACTAASGAEAFQATAFGLKLKALLERRDDGFFTTVYPCHSPSRRRWFHVAVRSLDEGAIVTHTDITEEYLRLENDARKSIQSAIIHDLRSPLNAVMGFADLGKSYVGFPGKEARLADFLTQIGRAGQRMLDNVDELLLRAEEAHEARSSEERPIDLTALIDEVTTQASPMAVKADVRIIREGRPGHMRLLAEEHGLWRVLTNLVTNAIKYNKPAGTVRIWGAPNASGGVEITVQDDGVGIGADDLPKIFDLFSRAAHSAEAGENRPASNGIGLAVVREIIHRHEGMIRVSSAPDVGTSVTVVFPSWRTVEDRG